LNSDTEGPLVSLFYSTPTWRPYTCKQKTWRSCGFWVLTVKSETPG